MPLKPLEPPYPPDIEKTLQTYPSRDGEILALFRVFANSRRFLGGKGVVNLLDKGSPITLREREIVILRVTANLECEYEWGVHVAGFARAAGFTEAQIVATTRDDPSAVFEETERLLLDVVDELCASGTLAQTRDGFEATWTAEQQLEILALVGNYHTISYVANAARLAGEPYGAKFPSHELRPEV